MEQYFGLTDARVSPSNKELPVRNVSIIGRKIPYLDNFQGLFHSWILLDYKKKKINFECVCILYFYNDDTTKFGPIFTKCCLNFQIE